MRQYRNAGKLVTAEEGVLMISSARPGLDVGGTRFSLTMTETKEQRFAGLHFQVVAPV